MTRHRVDVLEEDGRLWAAFADVVHVLGPSAAAPLLLAIERGELRAREEDGATFVLAEDLLALERAGADAAGAFA